MTTSTPSQFQATLLRPAPQDDDANWTFVVLPPDVSALLPRRGRTTVVGTLNGHAFQVLLEPDGQKSHWMRINEDLMKSAGVEANQAVQFEVCSADHEPEPDLPEDLDQALRACPPAREVWESTTTIARLDWIHWIISAKQAKTRTKRVADAIDMLEQGKRRVCCFDPSGFYSKAFKAPTAASEP